MVLGSALCALNLASTVMANGVCCIYEMQREEERRKEQEDAIRQAIHTEWEHQRFLRMMDRQNEKDRGVSHSQEDRRQRLMMTKQSSALSTDRSSERQPLGVDLRDRSQIAPCNCPVRPRSSSFGGSLSESSNFAVPLPKIKGPIRAEQERPILKSASTRSLTSSGQHYPERQLSSLMDSDEEDFEDINME